VTAEPPIACSLESEAGVQQRLAEWQMLLARAVARAPTADGVRAEFPPGPELAAEIGRLAALEAACCAWMDFTVHVASDRTTLDVRAPVDGRELVVSLFGAAE
jgi:hypothetical protein